ncbi:MAG: SH3 domain-containing protein [Lentisphaerota bacterium]
MKKTKILLCVAGLLLVSAAVIQAETKVRVQGQRVNLRAKALPESETVGQVEEGEILDAKSFQDEWVEVIPPAKIDLWVHRDFMSDGTVTANKLYVRGGPGINYSVVGTLVKGDTMTTRGEFGEWIKVAPLPSTSLWINRSFVQIVMPDKPQPPPATTAALPPPDISPPMVQTSMYSPVKIPPSKPGASRLTVKDEKPVVPPADLDLIPLDGQGRFVQREGLLRYVGFVFGRPSRYRLVRYEDQQLRTLCYVRGNNNQLHSFLGQTLLIRGREYWVKGIDDPVVIPEQIVPRVGEQTQP